MRASPAMIAAMVADIDFQRVGKGGEVDIVGAEEKGELRLGRDDIPDADRLCIAEHQAAHAARRHMDDIEAVRSEEHTSELQSLMRISYADFCLKKIKPTINHI